MGVRRARGGMLADTVFISYTHVDNEPFGPEQQRWVSHLHEQLTARVRQLSGEVAVWRDEKLQGNDLFAEELAERLGSVAVLVSVCSPRYLTSEWCRRELVEFVRAAEARGGLRVGAKSRLFKVLKTPVPFEELPQPLVPVLGYEFYEEVPGSGRAREYLLNPDPQERWKFYARVDDLAQDIAALLAELAAEKHHAPTPHEPDGRIVYLAESTADVAPYRDALRRELERQGHVVLPEQPLPWSAGPLMAAVDEALQGAAAAIHLLGSRHGARPEGETRSIPELQVELAAGRARDGHLAQLVWLPTDPGEVEPAQLALIERLQAAELSSSTELVRSPLEAFTAHVLERLAAAPAPAAAPGDPGGGRRVYLVHAPEDAAPAAAVRTALEDAGHTVAVPLTEGSDAEAREVHEVELVVSDAVLVYYGLATEHWLRMKLLDLVKARGWGRHTPHVARAVAVAPPATPHKSGYSTNEAMVLAATGPPSSYLGPFLALLDSPGAGGA